jgi:hypothetical protein
MHYARHFTLLACITALLAVIGSSHVISRVDSAFALYGALHAFALVVSIRSLESPPSLKPLWRRILFVAAAALLCTATVRLGFYGARFAGKLFGSEGPLALLGIVSALGALAYGILIRQFLKYPLALDALTITSLACMSATLATFAAAAHFQVRNTLWVAVPWWFAFSACLWYYGDRRRLKP